MSYNVFDVANCDEGLISPVWVDIESGASADYSESESNLCASDLSDVYVDPNISQECIEEGCGTEQGEVLSPFHKRVSILASPYRQIV